MAQIPDPDALILPPEAFDKLMPLHLRLDGAGRITGCGPTFAKLVPGQSLLGRPVFDAFEIRRPSGVTRIDDLLTRPGERLRLTLRHSARPVHLRGLAMPLAGGRGWIVNLSFGIGVADAVRAFDLTDVDFAATDLAVEMMYLVEAKTAAMETLKSLALRLQGDKQAAETQAMTDTLTGLRNRRALAQALERLTRAGLAFGLMHIDLDFFKAVNDTMGHAAGDHVLRRVADILHLETRAEDTVARVGGDEFVAVFPDLTDIARLNTIACRIIEAISQPIPFDGRLCQISASVGITTSDAYPVPEIGKMQHDADEALYASKRAGRGQARVYSAAPYPGPPPPHAKDRRSA